MQTVYSYPYTYLIYLILSADNVYLLLSVLKEINPEYSLEGLMPKMTFQHFDHLMQRVDPLENTLMLGKVESERWKDKGVAEDAMDMTPTQ